MTVEPRPTYQLKIVLRDTSPPVWRRVTLPADTSLGCLHDIIQVCFGWDDSHLHSFTEPASNRQFVGFEAPLDRVPFRDSDEESVTVAEVLPCEGGRLEYTYDFGDAWRHRITLEKILPASTPDRRVRCTGGRRAMPCAEDIGADRESVPVRPVSLAPRADLAAAARQVPLIASALRLAHWCQGGRAVTSRGVLKPALGRQALQELAWTRRGLGSAAPRTGSRRSVALRPPRHRDPFWMRWGGF
ncbi:plasmid pRiA4b ORF-3 family protein [Streptomyces sp. NPDC058291]|uniref:plasmid pRiA4b ORF-3 family protein n=1 Tax=Streptomyces sp. NPDC058291 TaxID=3346427 RepID=UPI0036F002CB